MGTAHNKLLEKIYSRKVFYIFIILFLVWLSYKDIFGGFFQQDEWFIFGRITGGEFNLKSILNEFVAPRITHVNPLTDIITLAEFKIFGMCYQCYALVSIIGHLLSTLFLFKLAKLVFKKDSLALIASIIFALSASHYQATSWVVVNHATQGATIFGLLSIFLFLKFLNHKNVREGDKFFILSLVSIVIALFFKEIIVATFFVFIAMIGIYKNKSFYEKRKYLPIIAILIIYLLSRVAPLILNSNSISPETVSVAYPKVLLANLLTLPSSSLSQALVPVDLLISVSREISYLLPQTLTGSPDTTEHDTFVLKRLLVIVSFIIFVAISLAVLLVYKYAKDKVLKKGILFGYILAVFNSFIFLLSPERSGIMSIVDSRNLYFVSIGTSLFLAGLLALLSTIKRTILFILFPTIVLLNLSYLNSKLESVYEVGSTRKEILSNIESRYTNLPDKVVFYFESDKAYYGLPDTEKTLPFQSGFGQTLLVWYNQNENFPQEMFQKRFLWGITDQGYKEFEGRGFGYFRDFNLLTETVKKYNLPPDAVIGFSWKHETKSLEDISNRVIQDLPYEKTN